MLCANIRKMTQHYTDLGKCMTKPMYSLIKYWHTERLGMYQMWAKKALRKKESRKSSLGELFLKTGSSRESFPKKVENSSLPSEWSYFSSRGELKLKGS